MFGSRRRTRRQDEIYDLRDEISPGCDPLTFETTDQQQQDPFQALFPTAERYFFSYTFTSVCVVLLAIISLCLTRRYEYKRTMLPSWLFTNQSYALSAEAIPILRSSDAPSSSREGTTYRSTNACEGAREGAREGGSKGGAADSAATGQGALVRKRVIRALAYGMVNGVLLPPVSVSFAAIIFRDPAFTPHLPRLVKLVMLSGSVHMACFAALSGLKFAVGSVQDAGLIFLSAIAATVVTFSRERGLDEAAMLSTVCFTLCACTGLLGVTLVVLGRLRLATLVQYLPMPVVGGYLAFIGYFCGQAGLAFATGLEITSVRDLSKLGNPESFVLVTPAVVAGVVYFLCLRRFSSPMTLPLLLALFLGIFFTILATTGTSLEEARALKWVSEASSMLPLFRAWDYFSLADVEWGAMVRVIPNFLAMTVVVAFSSCLDVAAIEMEMGAPLDFNGELQTVGWSNVISGLLGGFTGSYIFSQTIFNLRADVDTRLAGATTCIIFFAAAASPASVISYLPRAFFGSLLVLISIDLMVEWLWQARLRMMRAEYIVCLGTFVAIQACGVEEGMAAGLVLAALSFTITYAQVPTVMTARVKASTVMRTFEERVILQAYRQQTVVLELQGYIFFGSATKILANVKERVVWGGEQSGTITTKTNGGGRRRSRVISTASDPVPSNPPSARIAKSPKCANDRNSLSSNYGLPPVAMTSGKIAPEKTRVARPTPVSSPRRNLLSARSDCLHNSMRVSSNERDLQAHVTDHEHNGSEMTLPLDPGGGLTSDSQMKGTDSSRRRWYSWQKRSVSQQQPQRQLQESSSLNSNAATKIEDGTTAPSANEYVCRQPLARQLSQDDNGSRWASSNGTDSRRKNDVGGAVPTGAANPQADTTEMIWPKDRRAHLNGARAASAVVVTSAARSISGAVEDGDAEDKEGGADPPRGISTPKRATGCPQEASFTGGESGAGPTMDGTAQTYMSLWVNGGSSTTDGDNLATEGGRKKVRSRRKSSAVSVLPRPEQRTRRVVLDFSNVVGVDATAARSCFLMLKIVLRASAVEVVFSGMNPKIQLLLRSHRVIADHDAVFDSLDTALEWSEEMILKERKADTMLRRRSALDGSGGCGGYSGKRRSARAISLSGGTEPPSLSLQQPLQPREISPAQGVIASDLQMFFHHDGDGDEDEAGAYGNSEVFPSLTSARKAEAAAFLGDRQDYYSRAGSLRRRSSGNAWIAHAGGYDDPETAGDVGSLQSILEDYIEVDRYQVSKSTRSVLREAHRFFRQEHVEAGVVIMDNTVPAEKLFFIGAGSVDLQITGELGSRGRLLKICAGGTFGEVGFYLRMPQVFRAIAREPCHLHTLDREGMAKMQRENAELCVLVQKAVLKSMCLATLISIESAHFGPVDQGGAVERQASNVGGRY